MIPYARQEIGQDDIDAVDRVLRSDWITQGPLIPKFEKAVAARCGAEHGVAVSSATAALHLVFSALNLGKGDRLWTSPNTFVATANSALYCGAEVDFVDIDPATLNMSVEALAFKLIRAEREGRLPKVVVPVHFGGCSCDMKAIHSLSKQYDFRVVEDAAHAIGGRYCGGEIGSCSYSDATVFSFHPVKMITTGEGGMVVTNNSDLAERINLHRSHGITRDESKMHGDSDGAWYYEQLELGFNYRLTDFQAALGLSQLSRLDQFLAKRLALANRYQSLLKDLPLTSQSIPSCNSSAWHLFVIKLSNTASRREVFDRLRDAGIGVNVHYIPVHLQPFYRAQGFKPGDYPEAERYYSAAITLPLYPALKESEQDYVVRQLVSILGEEK